MHDIVTLPASVDREGVARRFWALADRSAGDAACWLWRGHRDVRGYGVFRVARGHARQRWRAHRLAFVLRHGLIPTSLDVCHVCDVPACVNPLHLVAATRAFNNADRAAKGRSAVGDRHGARAHPETVTRGEEHPRAKLTWEAVEAIRASAEATAALAARFGVSVWSIRNVVNWRTWARPDLCGRQS